MEGVAADDDARNWFSGNSSNADRRRISHAGCRGFREGAGPITLEVAFVDNVLSKRAKRIADTQGFIGLIPLDNAPGETEVKHVFKENTA